jgi:hypothetical protein
MKTGSPFFLMTILSVGMVNRDSDNFTLTDAFPSELSESVKQHATTECSEQQFVVETVVQGETCFYQVFSISHTGG